MREGLFSPPPVSITNANSWMEMQTTRDEELLYCDPVKVLGNIIYTEVVGSAGSAALSAQT